MADSECKFLLRAADIEAAETSVSHPWNPRSLLIGTHLSGETGLQRTGVSLARMPAGHESFAYHAHHLRNPFDEDLVYLMGGENRKVEVADFPRLDRRMVRLNGEVVVYELSSGSPLEGLSGKAQD